VDKHIMVNSRLQEIMNEFQGDDAPDQLPARHHARRGDPRAHDDDDYEDDEDDDEEDDYDDEEEDGDSYDSDDDDYEDDDEYGKPPAAEPRVKNNNNSREKKVGLSLFASSSKKKNRVNNHNNNKRTTNSNINIHDQLPDPDEYKAQIGYQRRRRPTSRLTRLRRKRFLVTVSIFTFVVVLAIVLGTVLSKRNGGPRNSMAAYQPPPAPPESSSGTDQPESTTAPQNTAATPSGSYNQNRLNAAMEVVKYLSSLTALDQSGSPQQQAVLWIANIDPRQIQIGETFEFQSRYALAVLYFATGGGSGHWEYATEMGWLGDADVCDWNTVLSDGVKIGVDCLGTRTVRTLVLPHSGLINNIPDEISILYDLDTIDFSENDLTGRFNPRLGDLKTLQTLVLRDNAFTGSFPQFLGIMSSLQYVDLSKNNIKGSFPDSIFDLGRMTTLNIGYNHISDDVTKFMGLTSIQNLLASDNEISGHLNFELLNALPHLNILDLSSNQLQGSLPSNLFELSQLSIIDLHGNYFGGTIPQTIANPSPLKFLALGDNALTGEITWFPTHFPSTMEHLDLANNSFTGRLPAFGTMQGLNYLFLAFNPKLDPGPIPPSFTRLPNLIELSLQQTGRTGTIPKGFGSLSKLVLFDLSDNSLTGTIPDDFGNATLIQFLFLNQNYLNGTIPASFSQFSHLNMLLLEKNAIRGDTTMICEPKLSSLQFFHRIAAR